ncbi:MAG: CHAT domain-containing protein, partial [bacterium]|nr:CHAT domain-containing protein [bacterium]
MPVGFDVEINKSLKEGFLSVIWRNPGANTENSFEAETPVFKKEHIHTDSLWPNAKQALETGTRLFNFLDGGGDFRRALKEAEFRDQPLQLGISTCKETHDWPLELVAHNGVFLLCGKCLLVRKAVGRNGDKKIVAQKRPLKLLFMAGSPLDVQPLLGFEKEEEMIFDVIEKTAVDLEVEDSGTLEGLAERLQHEAYDVVHLSGHADIDKNGVPFFILETETGGRRDVSCELLWNAALKKNPPRLLFLSGCRTGEAAGDGAVSFARVMVETYDIPAVLGWGRSVRDVQASIAARKIYGELSLGRSVPEAVKQARFILMEHFARHPEWPLLRLFSWGGQVGALVEEGQKAKPKPRILKHKYLADSSVKVLAEGFVGRRRQLQQCIRVLTEENDNIGVLIQGTGGLGKSCLAGKVCERFSNHHLIVVHGVFNDISLHNALDRAFSEVGDEQGKEILQAEKKMTEKLQALCAGSFKNKKYLFVLDDFERNIKGATEGAPGSLTVSAAQLLTVLLYSLPACNKETQLIITCRYDFSLARQSADLVTQRLQVVTLTGFLHAEQLKKVRELRHIINYPDAETARKLTSAGCGNPRLMESLDLLVGQMGQAEVPVLLEAVADKKEEFIRKHVVRELVAKGGEGFDVFVSGFGIYRVPVATNGAKIIGKSMDLTDRETGELLERGVGLGLVEYDQARGVFQVTPLLREELV